MIASPIPPAKLTALHNAVLAACDKLDGAADGRMEDPRRCRFDPAALACRGKANDSCLTRSHIDAVAASGNCALVRANHL